MNSVIGYSRTIFGDIHLPDFNACQQKVAQYWETVGDTFNERLF